MKRLKIALIVMIIALTAAGYIGFSYTKSDNLVAPDRTSISQYEKSGAELVARTVELEVEINNIIPEAMNDKTYVRLFKENMDIKKEFDELADTFIINRSKLVQKEGLPAVLAFEETIKKIHYNIRHLDQKMMGL